MLISVIIPIYNIDQYLKECVESVLCQSYRHLEIILVDDGSTDSSPAICDEYALKDDRIKVIHKQNGGLSSARNAGIEVATGEYFFFLDSDDFLCDDIIEFLVKGVNEYRADISICSLTSKEKNFDIGLDGGFKKYSPQAALKEIFMERAFHTSACAKLFRRQLFDNVQYPEGKIYEDYATVYKLFWGSEIIVFSDAKKYYYRYNPASITKAKFNERHLIYFEISDEIYAFTNEHCPKLKKYVLSRQTKFAISMFRQMSRSGYDNQSVIKIFRDKIKKHIWRYLFSRCPFTSKCYGLLIVLMPRAALKLFRSKG